MRKVKLHYSKFGNQQIATVYDDGYYCCELHRCSDESERKFKARARGLKALLSQHPAVCLVSTNPLIDR